MNTRINITKEYYQINIPVSEVYENEIIRKFLDYLRIREISSKSEASDEDIKNISDDIKKDYWQKHKKELLDETGN